MCEEEDVSMPSRVTCASKWRKPGKWARMAEKKEALQLPRWRSCSPQERRGLMVPLPVQCTDRWLG